jgi:hypothetical protein
MNGLRSGLYFAHIFKLTLLKTVVLRTCTAAYRNTSLRIRRKTVLAFARSLGVLAPADNEKSFMNTIMHVMLLLGSRIHLYSIASIQNTALKHTQLLANTMNDVMICYAIHALRTRRIQSMPILANPRFHGAAR